MFVEILKKYPYNKARITKITTAHGSVMTPAFMPVGTRAFVNQMTPDDLVATGSQIILGGNTYHMLCSPGMEMISNAGGMHKLMNWHAPMLTDSGGYQVFSLSHNSNICRIDAAGAHFKHPNTGQIIHLTPESSIKAQKVIGADIIMAFDECTNERGGREAAVAALERTHKWLLISKAIHDQDPQSIYGYPQALFAIIQGGSFRDLRQRSAEFMLDLDMDGYAVGGEVIGYAMPQTCEIISWLESVLPQHKTRYAMGVGLGPQDLFEVVAEGIDIFDCVAPTRNARHGTLYCGRFVIDNHWLKFVGEDDDDANTNVKENTKLAIKKSIYAKDENPIMKDCLCYTCKNYTRAYLHYLFKQKSTLYNSLACIHNVYVMQEACRRMHDLIMQK